MKYTRISELNKQFEELYDVFNKEYFDNKLPPCVITIQEDSTRVGSYGWCTSQPVWKENKKEYYEINMCAEHNARTVTDVASTLLHEMVHLDNIGKGVKDTSRGGTYHNNKFKENAEQHHLIVGDKDKYGWHKTTLDDTARELALSVFGQIHLHRVSDPKAPKVRKPSSTRKYVCPFCEMSVRATKEVRILCYDCQCLMEVEE